MYFGYDFLYLAYLHRKFPTNLTEKLPAAWGSRC